MLVIYNAFFATFTCLTKYLTDYINAVLIKKAFKYVKYVQHILDTKMYLGVDFIPKNK